jgi:hypothetical protein
MQAGSPVYIESTEASTIAQCDDRVSSYLPIPVKSGGHKVALLFFSVDGHSANKVKTANYD